MGMVGFIISAGTSDQAFKLLLEKLHEDRTGFIPLRQRKIQMTHNRKSPGILAVILSTLWLAACGSLAPTSTPTADLNPLRTEVAATVYAEVTFSLGLTPSATQPPAPTATPRPTGTPTRTIASPFTSTPAGTTSATATLEISLPENATGNRAQWVSQSVADDTIFAPNETFSMTWTLKNVGTTTWTAGYMLRFYSGDALNAPKEVLLERDVLPGDLVDITVEMRAPARTGEYPSVWVMSDEARSNFQEPVYLQIVVAIPLTPTRTPTPSPTP
jgi:hypothetical protein